MKNDRNELIDIAFGKKCKQSSYSPWSHYNESGLAVAGPSERDWSFHTELEDSPWWSVDLGWEYQIKRIIINNRKLAPERARWMKVQVSNDEINWLDIFTGFQAFTFDQPFYLELGGEISARFLKISINGVQYLHLNRIQVLSTPETVYKSEVAVRITKSNDYIGRQINCAVVGTSNSLSKTGYTKYLETEKNVIVVENLSLGASHSGLLSYRISELPDTPYDYIILDTAPNDQGAIDAKCHNESVGDKFTESAVRDCLVRGAIPIIMIIPFQLSLEKYLKTGSPPETLTHLKIIADKWSVPILDGYALVTKIVQLSGRGSQAFFDDPYHPTELVQRLLAIMLADIMERTIRSDEVMQKIAPSSKFYSASQMKEVGKYTINRSNSLVNVDLLKLNENEGFHIHIGDDEKLSGVLLNMSGSTGAIALNDSFIKRLDFSQSVPPLCMALWNFQEQIEGPDVFVKCVKIDGRPMERTEHSQKSEILEGGGPTSVEIVGFVTLGKDIPASYHRPVIRGLNPEILVDISSGTFRAELT